MNDEPATSPQVIHLATPADIALIEELDSLSTSPRRNIHHETENRQGDRKGPHCPATPLPPLL